MLLEETITALILDAGNMVELAPRDSRTRCAWWQISWSRGKPPDPGVLPRCDRPALRSIRLSPPLCPGVVLESLEPEFWHFHAGRSELRAKKGAGVLFCTYVFRGGIGGTRRLRV